MGELTASRERRAPTSVVVRAGTASDRDAVAALWREAFPDDPPRNDPLAMLARVRARDPEALLVAEIAGSIAGAVLVGYDGNRGWIHHLAVRAARRRRGVGRALLRSGEERLRALGCPKVNLQVLAANREVVAFYERLGYAIEERISLGKVL